MSPPIINQCGAVSIGELLVKRTIQKAISQVLVDAQEPLTPAEIYGRIRDMDLYDFQAADPLQVVKTQLRRYCRELDFPSARRTKYFTMREDGRFSLLDKPVKVPSSLFSTGDSQQDTTSGSRVYIPPAETEPDHCDGTAGPTHTEIQGRLLDLGAAMGLSVWAPRNDRGKMWNGRRISANPNLLERLPRQFDEATNKTIEYIDVLWMDVEEIVAAFEVEHTSTIYSGLLRMSDLVTMQPNLRIHLYLVAPDERFAKFAREIARPTFSRCKRPIHELCRFVPYDSLIQRLNAAADFVKYLRPDFIEGVAERYDPLQDS